MSHYFTGSALHLTIKWSKWQTLLASVWLCYFERTARVIRPCLAASPLGVVVVVAAAAAATFIAAGSYSSCDRSVRRAVNSHALPSHVLARLRVHFRVRRIHNVGCRPTSGVCFCTNFILFGCAVPGRSFVSNGQLSEFLLRFIQLQPYAYWQYAILFRRLSVSLLKHRTVSILTTLCLAILLVTDPMHTVVHSYWHCSWFNYRNYWNYKHRRVAAKPAGLPNVPNFKFRGPHNLSPISGKVGLGEWPYNVHNPAKLRVWPCFGH